MLTLFNLGSEYMEAFSYIICCSLDFIIILHIIYLIVKTYIGFPNLLPFFSGSP